MLGAAWAFASNASAHDPPHGKTLLWASADAEATPAIIVANRGLVFADTAASGATTFSLRCYEAYGGGLSEPPGVFRDTQGSLTIGVFNAVQATSDRACSMQPSSGLPASVESLGVVVQDPATANRLFVASRTFDRAALYVSEDHGQSWSEHFQNRMDDYFHALIPAPSDASRLYAAGRRADRVNQKLIYFSAVSLDGGENWQEHVLPAEIIPFAVHPSDPDVLFAYEPTNVLETEFRVLRSTDRGAMFTPVLEQVALPTALAAGHDAATLWLGIGADGGLYRSGDGGQHFERVHADSLQSVTCLARREDRLWLCANMAPNTDGIWFSDDQGTTFEKWMEFADVTHPVMCAQPAAQSVCDLAWQDFDRELHPRLPDAGVDAGAPPNQQDAGSEEDATAPSAAGDASGAMPSPIDAAPPADAPPTSRKRSTGCHAAPGRPVGVASAAWLALVLAALRRARARRAPLRIASSAA